jgi:hypothetical protein
MKTERGLEILKEASQTSMSLSDKAQLPVFKTLGGGEKILELRKE